jgi:hypothetical protein
LSAFRLRRVSGTQSRSPQPRQIRWSADLFARSALLGASGVLVVSLPAAGAWLLAAGPAGASTGVVLWLVLPAAGAWLLASGASPRSFLVGDSSGPAGASPGVVAPRPACSACCRAVVRALRHRRFWFRLARARSLPRGRGNRGCVCGTGVWAPLVQGNPARVRALPLFPEIADGFQ